MLEIIAEISGCHGGSLDNALQLIEEAKQAGATGVKFQCFEPRRLSERREKHPRLAHMDKIALRDLYESIRTPQHWFPEMIAKARELDLTWHASVFDPEDVEFLETLDCPRYKIASFEAHDRDLAMAVELTKKPIIVSANQDENVHPPPGGLVLHATNYAVAAKDANLERIKFWARDRIKWPQHFPWGLSDHTTNAYSAMIATALGARMIEWHIKLPEVSTPDDAFSLDRLSFHSRAAIVRDIEECLRS